MNSYSKTLVNPTEDRVLFYIVEALSAVQTDARVRKLHVKRTLDGYEKIFQLPAGTIQTHGGQPSNVSGSYSTGHTTRLGVAWWTDRDGNKHIKIISDRTQASNFSVPDIFGYTKTPCDIVFSDGIICESCLKSIQPEDSHWREGRFACDICVEIQRYLDETGFLPGRRN
jgi:hypothetical protein